MGLSLASDWQQLLSLAVALAVGSACTSAPRVNPWALETTPFAAQSAESIGSTSSGCLVGAVELESLPGQLELMRPERRRHFGHPMLKRFLADLTEKYKKRKLGALLVGDAAQARGGPFLTGHKSHQTGLDADLWFDSPKPAQGETFSQLERQSVAPQKLGQMPTVVKQLWTARMQARIRLAAQDERVERIFVHPSIKRALCEVPKFQEPTAAGWMARLRPWWGHDYHFHVRLKCPVGESQCRETTDPIPAGNGCDASLDWWFTEEATTAGKAPENQPGADPTRVPQACLLLLSPLAK